ncbi:hypothetical protein ACFL0C_00205 [Patescibacteria group bacterium]
MNRSGSSSTWPGMVLGIMIFLIVAVVITVMIMAFVPNPTDLLITLIF